MANLFTLVVKKIGKVFFLKRSKLKITNLSLAKYKQNKISFTYPMCSMIIFVF